MVKCKRITDEQVEPIVNPTFSLLPALEDGYFHDLNITAANKKQVLPSVFSSMLPSVGAPSNCTLIYGYVVSSTLNNSSTTWVGPSLALTTAAFSRFAGRGARNHSPFSVRRMPSAWTYRSDS